MQGHFDLVKYGTRGLKAEDFDQAIKDRCLDELLAEMPEHQRASTDNRIFDNMAGYVLQRLFQVGNCGWPYNETDNEAALAGMAFLTTDADTTSYTEDWGGHNYYPESNYETIVYESIGSSGCGKLFINDSIYGYTIAKVSGVREAIYYKDRFFFNTYEALTGSGTYIRSVGIHYKERATDHWKNYYDALARIGRCRLKNSRGETVSIHKTNYEVLQLEYTFSLVSF